MSVCSRAVVLGSLRYSDSTVVLKAYTEVAGLRSLLLQVGKGPKAQAKSVLLQPCTLVQVSFRPEKPGLVRATSIERDGIFTSLPFNVHKSAIALFMAEVVAKSTHDDHPDEAMFGFLYQSVSELDLYNGTLNLHPLKFVLHLCDYYGLRPALEPTHEIFDLMEGRSSTAYPPHVHHLSGKEYELLYALLTDFVETSHSNETRHNLLVALIDYLRIHLHGMKEVNAHHVLREVLRS